MTETADSPQELSITRHIAAPPDKVWHVLTERQAEWWCPKPWTITIVEQDRRPGGRAAMVMHGPDGETMPQEGIYLAYEEGRRFVTTDAVGIDASGDFLPAGPFMVGFWEIAAEGDGTRYTARARHWSAEAMEQHRAMGFVDGWTACADQLAALCEGE
ncbi:SRPBCC family protein [Sphingobium sufflavum]|uniref:SRPBCC family protein n=1 Tax=Sphingobium sufflavum TaxID=1129547 RepID=UPI001F415E59|nr:SRPBCC family protein [Sphingobium sufflavum]MCE7795270.1 SRPBCC family protein [Sphingobium sufflavum]